MKAAGSMAARLALFQVMLEGTAQSSTQVLDCFSVVTDSHNSTAVSDAQQYLSFYLHLP